MKLAAKLRMIITGLAILYILIPILVTIPASFTEASFPSFPPQGFSFEWYAKLLNRPEFVGAFLNSIQFALFTALFSVVLGTMSALAIAKYDLPGSRT